MNTLLNVITEEHGYLGSQVPQVTIKKTLEHTYKRLIYLNIGCAIVTKKDAALFTDGRYFLQACKELDSKHWKLMKQGLPGVPTWQEYLIKVIT